MKGKVMTDLREAFRRSCKLVLDLFEDGGPIEFAHVLRRELKRLTSSAKAAGSPTPVSIKEIE